MPLYPPGLTFLSTVTAKSKCSGIQTGGRSICPAVAQAGRALPRCSLTGISELPRDVTFQGVGLTHSWWGLWIQSWSNPTCFYWTVQEQKVEHMVLGRWTSGKTQKPQPALLMLIWGGDARSSWCVASSPHLAWALALLKQNFLHRVMDLTQFDTFMTSKEHCNSKEKASLPSSVAFQNAQLHTWQSSTSTSINSTLEYFSERD